MQVDEIAMDENNTPSPSLTLTWTLMNALVDEQVVLPILKLSLQDRKHEANNMWRIQPVDSNICDLAWENRAYVHIKFDHFFRLWSFITLYPNILSNKTFVTSTAHKGELKINYGTHLTYTEG